jgi:hypothetical protein
VLCAAIVLTPALASADIAYPLTLVASASVSRGATTITTAITIQVNRLIEPSRRDRLLAGLRQNGFRGFFDVLRPLPVIGSVQAERRSVPVKYAWQTADEGKHRLVVAADAPLFFLPGDDSKSASASAYQLTVVDLLIDDSGSGTGVIAGAARVRPAPDGGIILDDYANTSVQLTVRPSPK